MSYSIISRERAKQDVINYIKSKGIEIDYVAKCVGNVEYQEGYTTYYYEHEWDNVKLGIDNFIELKFKTSKSDRLYAWFTIEGNYRYLHIGFFEEKGNILILKRFTLGVPMH